jgi:hypothetical protein
MKISILFIFVCFTFFVNSQSIKGVKNQLTFLAGSKKTSSLKLKSGEELIVRFKQFSVDVILLSKDQGVNLFSFPEDESFKVLKACEFDFDKDGINEIFIVKGDNLSILGALVFKKINYEYKIIGEMDGQFECILSPFKIELPYGSQGLFFEYKFVNGSFIEINN